MPADLLHRIWMGEESASEAFFSGASDPGQFHEGDETA